MLNHNKPEGLAGKIFDEVARRGKGWNNVILNYVRNLPVAPKTDLRRNNIAVAGQPAADDTIAFLLTTVFVLSEEIEKLQSRVESLEDIEHAELPKVPTWGDRSG